MTENLTVYLMKLLHRITVSVLVFTISS